MDKVMTHTTKNLSIYDISYPCYIAGIPKNNERIIHIPGKFEYQYLDLSYGYVLEGYKVENKIYLFDCIPTSLWNNKICNLEYEKRLRYLRQIINDEIANPDKILDLPMVLCESPFDVQDYLDNLLTSDCSKVRIMSASGYYVFGEALGDEYVEVSLEKKVR